MPLRIRNPPGHWRLLAFCALVVVVVIGFQGFASHTIGHSTEPKHPQHVRAALPPGRSVLAARGDRLVAAQPPPGRRIALTFDDGPDPRWTPRIAAVLRAERVPATFFVVGSEAAHRPEIVRRLVREGHEIGDHTFTHTSLSTGPLWQRRLQLELTQAVIAGITGRYARFVRPPYSATVDAVRPEQERELARLAGRRYYISLADFDGEDWRRPGVASIVRNATPPGSTGGTILLHDGGGHRAQTLAAVRELIPRLRARGFEFVRVSQLASMPSNVAAPPASGWDRRRGEAFASSIRIAAGLARLFGYMLLAIGVLVGLRGALLVTMASHHRIAARRRGPGAEHLPPLTVVVPAFNEAVGIERAVRSLVASDYPEFEVIVVDDGSTDDTAAIVAGLDLERVHLVRQDNGGKAAALNTGIALADAEVIVMVDGDTLFERETLRRLVGPMADPHVGAVAGNTKVGNRRRLLGRWQHIEYVMGFNLDRRMYEVLQCTPTVPGAIGAFRRDVLEEVGGVPGDTLAEDTDLTLAIGRAGHRVMYAEYARAWTEAPSTWGALWRQRYRWSFGTMQAVWKHRGALVSRDPRERRIGRRALPYMFLFQIVLPIAAPLVDLFTLYGLIFTDAGRVLALWGLFNLIQLLVAAFGFRLDREPIRVLWALPLQQLVYRQLIYLVIIESTVAAMKGVRSGWKHLPRTGDAVVGSEA